MTKLALRFLNRPANNCFEIRVSTPHGPKTLGYCHYSAKSPIVAANKRGGLEAIIEDVSHLITQEL